MKARRSSPRARLRSVLRRGPSSAAAALAAPNVPKPALGKEASVRATGKIHRPSPRTAARQRHRHWLRAKQLAWRARTGAQARCSGMQGLKRRRRKLEGEKQREFWNGAWKGLKPATATKWSKHTKRRRCGRWNRHQGCGQPAADTVHFGVTEAPSSDSSEAARPLCWCFRPRRAWLKEWIRRLAQQSTQDSMHAGTFATWSRAQQTSGVTPLRNLLTRLWHHAGQAAVPHRRIWPTSGKALKLEKQKWGRSLGVVCTN